MYAWEKYRAGEDSNGKPIYRQRHVRTRSPDRGVGNPKLPFTGATFAAPSAPPTSAMLLYRLAQPERRQAHL